MHRNALVELLRQHQPFDANEAAGLDRLMRFVADNDQCFERTLLSGHLTGSAWLLSHDGSRVLLTHHRKLNMWLQLGGHADGQADLLEVALREAREESGISNIVPISRQIFDLDVHEIPPRPGEPAHFHYDVRFLTQCVDRSEFVISDESHELRWFTADEVERLDVDQSVRRMNRKWRNQRTSTSS